MTRARRWCLGHAQQIPAACLLVAFMVKDTPLEAPVMVLFAISLGWWLGARVMAEACASEINRLREIEKSKARMVARARSKA